MAEFRVRFVGDLGNLAAFNSAIRGALSSNAATLERANSQVVSRALGQPVRSSSSTGAGLFIRNATTEIDRLNNSFIQSGTVVRRYVDGFTTETRKIKDAITGLTYEQSFAKPRFGEAYHSDFRKAQGNVEAYERAIARLAPAERRSIALERLRASQLARFDTASALVGAYQDLPKRNQTVARRQAVFEGVNRVLPGTILDPKQLIDIEGGLKHTVGTIQSKLHTQRTAIEKSLTSELTALRNNPIIRQISEEAFFAATSPEGRLGKQTVDLLGRYPSLRRDLEQKVGLGGGVPFLQADKKTINPQYAINAQNQGFEISNVYRDMERGLIRVSGAARGADGIMSQFSYSIDKNNNVVNSWGRSLSGARGFLNQTGRDLIKVIEYSIAASVVFGTLGVAMSAFSKINELNVNLQRFAITARLSNEELEGMFEGLSQVAFATATPIGELVKAADDMALATRRANQSTAEWQQSILELANAVGILTNISGLDTVKATELLVASMKQLNLETSELVPLLSKITAAAGGQSASITDIASALAVLAEAAEGALIPLEGQIAAVQVISQVTGKSAEQTANAFKNLFGAINSQTSVDKLEEFGIAVREANGDLRPFLDIYRDVADAINSGIIPQGRVNEVLRAISGGRTGRQADAAALVANIYRVFEVQGIAATASNEALIANAKILDTNQAKITRFQNAFDETIFKQFNEVVADLTATLADLGTVFASVFGGIPSQIITITVEILALLAAIKLLTKAGAALNIAGAFRSFRTNLLPPTTTTNIIEGSARARRVPGAELFSLLSPEQQDQYLAQRLSNRKLYSPTPLTDRGIIQSSNLRRTRVPRDVGFREIPYAERLTNRIGNYYYQPGGYRDYPEGTRAGPTPDRLLPYHYGPIAPPPTGGTIPRRMAPINISERLRDIGSTGNYSFGGAYVPIKMDGETKSVLQRFMGVFGKTAGSRFGKFGIGAAAGAGLAAASGGGDLSGLAQGVGAALLFTPAAPVGAGLLVGGAILDHFSQQTEKAKANVADLQSTLYNLTLQWKQDSAAVSAAQTVYNTIQGTLRSTAKDTEEYTTLQKNLAEATVTLALAQSTQANSTKEILDNINKLKVAGGEEGLGSFAGNLAGRQLDEGQVRELVGIVSKQILAASGQPVFNPTTTNFDPKNLNYTPTTNEDITLAKLNAFGFIERYKTTPTEFATDPNFFKNFLNTFKPAFGGAIDYSKTDFPFTNPAAVAAFETAAEDYRKNLPAGEQANFMKDVINPFQEAVAQFASAVTQIDQAIRNTRAEIEARQLLGLLSGKDAESATASLAAAEQLQSFINKPGAAIASAIESPALKGAGALTQGADIQASNATVSKLLANSLTGTFDPALFDTASEEVLKSLGVWSEFPDEISKTTAQAQILREVFGLTDTQIQKILGSLGNLKTTASDALDEAIQKTKEWRDSQLQGVGDRLLDLQARLQGGEFKRTKENPNGPEQYAALLAQLQETEAGINSVTTATDAFKTALGENASTAATALIGSLNALQINGFQGVEGSIDSANNALFSLITRLNLSGPQITAVVTKWVQVLALAAKAAQIASAIAALPSPAQLVSSGFTGGPGSFSNIFKQQTTYQNQMDTLLLQIKGVLGKGSGTAPLVPSGANTPKTGPKSTVDTLYLSEEQQKLADPQSLVKQAYQDALKLQAQIPGETKRNRLNTVVVFDELQKIFSARGVSEELLRRALDNLTDEMEKANQKADVIRRVRVGAGDFSAIANVPVNSTSGVSVAGNNQINVTFNLNGTNLTPAQFDQFANMIGAEIARRL